MSEHSPQPAPPVFAHIPVRTEPEPGESKSLPSVATESAMLDFIQQASEGNLLLLLGARHDLLQNHPLLVQAVFDRAMQPVRAGTECWNPLLDQMIQSGDIQQSNFTGQAVQALRNAVRTARPSELLRLHEVPFPSGVHRQVVAQYAQLADQDLIARMLADDPSLISAFLRNVNISVIDNLAALGESQLYSGDASSFQQGASILRALLDAGKISEDDFQRRMTPFVEGQSAQPASPPAGTVPDEAGQTTDAKTTGAAEQLADTRHLDLELLVQTFDALQGNSAALDQMLRHPTVGPQEAITLIGRAENRAWLESLATSGALLHFSDPRIAKAVDARLSLLDRHKSKEDEPDEKTYRFGAELTQEVVQRHLNPSEAVYLLDHPGIVQHEATVSAWILQNLKNPTSLGSFLVALDSLVKFRKVLQAQGRDLPATLPLSLDAEWAKSLDDRAFEEAQQQLGSLLPGEVFAERRAIQKGGALQSAGQKADETLGKALAQEALQASVGLGDVRHVVSDAAVTTLGNVAKSIRPT